MNKTTYAAKLMSLLLILGWGGSSLYMRLLWCPNETFKQDSVALNIWLLKSIFLEKNDFQNGILNLRQGNIWLLSGTHEWFYAP